MGFDSRAATAFFFFSDILRTLSEFFAQCPKSWEPFRTKCSKKFCLEHNITLETAPCSLTKLKLCKFVLAVVATVTSDKFFATCVLIETFSLVNKDKSFLRHTIVATEISRTGFVI